MCNSFAKSKQKQYFRNLDPKLKLITKFFWKLVKPLFSDKITIKEIINLTENGETLNLDIDITEMFNEYFNNIVQNLNIPRKNSLLNTDLSIIPILTAIEKYKYHQSNISINEKIREKSHPKFSFHFVTFNETIKEVALLSDKKVSGALGHSC